MKKTFPFLFLLLCISTFVSAQGYEDGLDFRGDLYDLGLQAKDIIIFDKKDTSAFITKCYLDTVHKQIHYFHCYGGLFGTMHISPPDMQAVLEKEITPFEYFNLVTIANLHFIQNAKENLQDNGSNAKFTADEKQYLQFDDSVKYPSTLTKLLSLDKRLADIETQFIQFNSVQPKYIKRKRIYYNTFFCEYGEMIVGHVRDSIATFYNKIDAQPVYKAVLDIRKATIDYYDRSNEIIDEIEINKNKVVLLATEKFDVFALYRAWLEWKRQNISEAIEETKKQATVPAIKKYALNELATQTKMLSDLDNKIFYLSNADIEYVRQRLRRKFGPLFAPFDPQETARMLYETTGDKTYELRDHRGNVMVLISDAKRGIPRKDDSTKVDHYEAIVVGATDYTSFGKPMEGRSFNSGDYPYGFNGKRNDPETGYQDYGMRIYDPQIGKFISPDPLKDAFAYYSPYQFAGNNPIKFIDLDGLEPAEPGDKVGETQTGTNGSNDIASSWTWTGKSWEEATLSPVAVTAKRDNTRAAFNSAFAFNYSQADAQKFIDQRATAFHRLNTKQPLVQQGDDPQYVYLSGNYKREYEADQSYRNMQLAAVAIIFAPIVLPELATAISGTSLLTTNSVVSSKFFIGAGADLSVQFFRGEKINWLRVGASGVFANPFTASFAGSLSERNENGGYQLNTAQNILLTTAIGGLTGSAAERLGGKINISNSTPISQSISNSIGKAIYQFGAGMTTGTANNFINPPSDK